MRGGRVEIPNLSTRADAATLFMNRRSAFGPGLSALLAGVAGLILLGAPLAGMWLAGQPLAEYLELPPRPTASATVGYSPVAFWLLATLVVAALTPLIRRLFSARAAVPERATQRHGLPVWGWVAFAWLVASWVLAWTRFSWFESFQQHTFTPLWLGYIGVVNALTLQRTGTCLLAREPARFAALFPLSALFWWFFEYLHRFVANWRYTGIGNFDALEYTLFATISFSTVLPAVTSTAEWLRSFARLNAAFQRWHRVLIPRPRLATGVVLAFTIASLATLGVFRGYLFALVWIAPALVIICLQALAHRPTVLAPLADGDWRGLVSYASAALVCGFFWEMWNYGSLARWEYSVPYVGRFHIFEMPLLGYAGYLPFGIECAAIAALLNRKELPRGA
jgi:hypothetical protein